MAVRSGAPSVVFGTRRERCSVPSSHHHVAIASSTAGITYYCATWYLLMSVLCECATEGRRTISSCSVPRETLASTTKIMSQCLRLGTCEVPVSKPLKGRGFIHFSPLIDRLPSRMKNDQYDLRLAAIFRPRPFLVGRHGFLKGVASEGSYAWDHKR